MMPERHRSAEDSDEMYRRIRTAIGLVLIVAGATMAFWVFVNAYRIFTNPQEIELFREIVPDNPQLRELDIDGKKVILPLGLFNFMAYTLGCLVLVIAGTVGGAFITGGVNILQSNILRFERRLNKRFENLRQKMDRIGDLLEKKSGGE